MPLHFSRNVRLASAVKEWISTKESEFPRLREAVKGLTWELARDPGRGHNLGTGKYVYSQLSNGVDGIPDPIWAAYSFTETELVVHNIGDDEDGLFF